MLVVTRKNTFSLNQYILCYAQNLNGYNKLQFSKHNTNTFILKNRKLMFVINILYQKNYDEIVFGVKYTYKLMF